MNILILDDDLERHSFFKEALKQHNLTHVHDVEEFEKALPKMVQWDWIFLDYDLLKPIAPIPWNNQNAVPGKSGAYAAMDIAKLPKDNFPKNVWIHSWNRWGAQYMYLILTTAQVPHIYVAEFGQGMFDGGKLLRSDP